MRLRTAILVVAACFAACIPSVQSSATMNFWMGTMYSGETTNSPAFPASGLLNLLALTNGGTWAAAYPDLRSALESLTSSWALPGSVLVGQIANDNSGGPGVTGGVFDFSYSGGFSPGDHLLLVAYPFASLSSISGPFPYGFYFRTDSVIDGSDISWVAPADGGTYALGAYTFSQGGSVPDIQFTSGRFAQSGSLTFTGSLPGTYAGGFGIPEPSTYALLLMTGAGALWWAKRRR